MNALILPLGLAYIGLLTAIAYIDVRTLIIPNKIIFPAIAFGTLLTFLVPETLLIVPLRASLCAMLAMVLPEILWGFKGYGMGDVKLIGFIGLITGFDVFLIVLAGCLSHVALATVIRIRNYGIDKPYPAAPLFVLFTVPSIILIYGFQSNYFELIEPYLA